VTNKKIEEDFLDFYARETEVQCVHAATAEILMPGPILPLSEGQDDADISNGTFNRLKLNVMIECMRGKRTHSPQ